MKGRRPRAVIGLGAVHDHDARAAKGNGEANQCLITLEGEKCLEAEAISMRLPGLAVSGLEENPSQCFASALLLGNFQTGLIETCPSKRWNLHTF